MGQRADLVNGPGGAVGRVAGEIESLRGELGGLVAELDRRRREALDLGLQVRRHPYAIALGVAAVALVAGGAVAVAIRSRGRRRRPPARGREARRALLRLLEPPDRVSREPRLGAGIAAVVGTVVATALARRLLER